MASIKKRSNGNLSLVFWWQGKQCIKALGTTNEHEAERIKQDAEAQLDRVRQGKSPSPPAFSPTGSRSSMSCSDPPKLPSASARKAATRTPYRWVN